MTLNWITLLWTLLFMTSCASGPHGKSHDEWREARQIAELHLRQAYGEAPAWKIDAEVSGVPFLFEVESPKEGAVLVHDKAVVTQKGIASLDRYLRGSRCVENRGPTARDMMVLLQLLEALPPDPKPTAYFRASNPHEAWRPRLDYLDGGRAKLTLYYRIDEPSSDDTSEDTSTEGTLREWTLTMDPGQMPTWTSKNRDWDREKGQWVVDHTN